MTPTRNELAFSPINTLLLFTVGAQIATFQFYTAVLRDLAPANQEQRA